MHAYVRDVVTTDVVAVRADTPYREMTAMFRTHRVSGFPVVDGEGKVTGVVSETDLLALAAADPDPGAHPAPWHPHRKQVTVGEATERGGVLRDFSPHCCGRNALAASDGAHS